MISPMARSAASTSRRYRMRASVVEGASWIQASNDHGADLVAIVLDGDRDVVIGELEVGLAHGDRDFLRGVVVEAREMERMVGANLEDVQARRDAQFVMEEGLLGGRDLLGDRDAVEEHVGVVLHQTVRVVRSVRVGEVGVEEEGLVVRDVVEEGHDDCLRVRCAGDDLLGLTPTVEAALDSVSGSRFPKLLETGETASLVAEGLEALGQELHLIGDRLAVRGHAALVGELSREHRDVRRQGRRSVSESAAELDAVLDQCVDVGGQGRSGGLADRPGSQGVHDDQADIGLGLDVVPDHGACHGTEAQNSALDDPTRTLLLHC